MITKLSSLVNAEEVLIKINGVGKKTASKIVKITNSKELFLAKGKQFWYNILPDDDVNKILEKLKESE